MEFEQELDIYFRARSTRIVSRPQADRWTVLVSIQRNECTMRPEIRWLDLSVQRTETT